MEIEEENSKSSDTGSETSDFSRDSESSDSTSVEIDPSEADELRRDVILYSRNKENVPLGVKNSVYDDDLPKGPPVLTSTPKVSFYQFSCPNGYQLLTRLNVFIRINSHQPVGTIFEYEK